MSAARHMEWRQCLGFPRFEVSEYGDLRKTDNGKRLKGYVTCDGYMAYRLRDENGHRHEMQAHRLVLEAFVGPKPSPRHQGAHADGSRLHNHPSNLRWALPIENHDDRRCHGTGPVGERNPKAKLTEADVVEIRRAYREIKTPGCHRRMSDLDETYGLHRSTILKIVRGELWSHVNAGGA